MSQKYSYLKIRLANPEEIEKWSSGEVINAETINYRTLKPERGGLFAEEIFGPTKDYQCACAQRSKKNVTYENKKCPICGVEITESRVRRESLRIRLHRRLRQRHQLHRRQRDARSGDHLRID